MIGQETLSKRTALVLGFGHMGRIHARHLESRGILTLHADGAEECLAALQNECLSDFCTVVIATPATTHFEYAKIALENGADVFVEKPLTVSLAEAEALRLLAIQRNALLFVGHSESYNPEFWKFVEGIRARFATAQLLSVEFIRHGTPTDRGKDVSVEWDLGVHDYALWFDLKKSLPEIDWQNVNVRFDERRDMPERKRFICAKFSSGFETGNKIVCDLDKKSSEVSDAVSLEYETFFKLRNLAQKGMLDSAKSGIERALFAVQTAERYSSPNNPK